MKYLVEKPKRRRFTENRVSKHYKILRELPADADSRTANIHRRNEILKASKLYQLRINRDRANAALATLPANQQANLRQLMEKHRQGLTDAMVGLAKKGVAL